MVQDDGNQRTFDTGATRDTAVGKLDYEACFSPRVMKRFAEYMLKHNTERSQDNWQKGMPEEVLVKSLLRHTMEYWLYHREGTPPARCFDPEDTICAIMFNAMALLNQTIPTPPIPTPPISMHPGEVVFYNRKTGLPVIEEE